MQDFQSIPGLSGRIFSAGAGAGAGGMDNRRLRGYPSSSPSPPAPVKCPRCESANTKFCYYNNYNLSQPRHFCKACRRYWTKGGVLRNVPVGGGCRKSSSKRSSSSSSAGGASKPSKSSDKARRRPPASGGSSSDSSTLTANDASGGALFTSQTSNPNPSPPPAFDPAAMEPIGQGPEIYGQDVGSFTTLMGSVAVPPPSSAPPTMLGFGYAHPPPPPASTMSAFRLPPDQKAAGMIDPTVQMDLPPFHGRSGGGGGMEWGTVDPTALFDLTAGSVDPAVYWSQTHWGDTDPSSLYLP